MNVRLSLLLIFGILVPHCGDETDRQEVVSKLRTLGVSANPLVGTPSPDSGTPESAELTLHVAVPSGQTPTLESYKDSVFVPNVLTLEPETIEVVTSSLAPTYVFPEFSIFELKARIIIPSASVLATLSGGTFQGIQLRYGLKVSAGGQEEKVVGNFNVYPTGTPESQWTNPVITILMPSENGEVAVDSDINIKAELNNSNQEESKIGWFVSSGEVLNRRALNTIWKVKNAGLHTLIVTARGVKSRGFAIKVIEVTGI